MVLHRPDPDLFAPEADLAHAVRLYPAFDLRVDSGANAGDPLPAPQDSICGDYYRLSPDARPLTLRLRLPSGVGVGPAGQVAAGSDIGRAGDAVTLMGRLSLMAPDGDLVEVLVVTLPGADTRPERHALPMAPLRPGLLYSLIAVDAQPGPIRLADAMAGAFAGGTRILLADGTPCPVEDLRPGMAVLTRDHGSQPLRWTGAVRLRAAGSLAPVVVQAGVMGNPRPLAVSPHHRMFLYRRDARDLAGAAELLVQARHLVDGQGITRRAGGHVVYHGLVFDRHEVIYAEGVPCESLLVCPATLTRLPEDLAAPLRQAFPGLSQRLHTGTDLPPDLVSRLMAGGGAMTAAPQRPAILAATDFSPRSAHVAGRAAALAQVLGARLILAHALPARPSGPAMATTGRRVRPMLARLGLVGRAMTPEAARSHLTRLTQALPVPAEPLLLTGPPETALARAAAEVGAVLIVLGLHRERRVLDVLRMTTMERIVLAAPVPVLIAHVSPSRPYTRVLALTDFAPASAAALRMAARLAPDARFAAVHALPVPLVAAVAGGDPVRNDTLTQAEMMRTAFLSLPGLPRIDPPPEIVPGGVHEVLAFRQQEMQADLVCIGTHSGRGNDRLGHYARDLMRAPPTDLLVASPQT